MSLVLVALLLAGVPHLVAARGDEVIGSVGVHRITAGESLIELAPQYDLGFNEIAAANPGLDPFVPEVGATAIIPTSWIVPAAAAPRTLVVNLSEMRLYFFPAASDRPITFPVGVAVKPGATPLGVLKVVEKLVDPTWYPTAAFRREDPTLPASVAPGPENPLGSHALRLSRRTLLFHDTSTPFGVGRSVSRGCIRLYPEDMRNLFRIVEVGTRVEIVREPVKIGLRHGRVFVEVHEDEALRGDLLATAQRLLRRRGLLDRVEPGKLADAVRARSGVPVDITADRR